MLSKRTKLQLNDLATKSSSHLLVRKDHVACTICGEIVPVHPGDGTPMTSFLLGLARVLGMHPSRKHERVWR